MRRILECLLSTALGIATMSAALAAEPLRIVTIGEGYWAAPLYVAQRADLFAKQDLDPKVSVVAGGALAAQALLSKNADVGLLSFEHIAQAASKGQRIVAVYRIAHRNIVNIVGSNELVKSSGSASVADKIRALQGKRVGVSAAGASSDKMLTVLGAKYGLDPSKIQKVFLGGSPAAYLAAFQNKQVDAAFVVEPAGSIIQQAGQGETYVNIMNGEEPTYDDLIFMVVAVHPDTLKEKPELLRKVTRVVQDAVDIIKTDPTQAKRLLAQQYPTMEPALNERVFAAMNGVWGSDGRMTDPAGKRVIDYLLKEGAAVDKVDVKQTFTNDYLPK